MVKKLVAYGFIAAGATAFMLGAAPAQATDQPAPATDASSLSSPYTGMGAGTYGHPSTVKVKIRKQNAKSHDVVPISLCDIHVLGIDHLNIGLLGQAKNSENAKCANSSFKNNNDD
jgi:hypothetical protein